jgi:hypothetical protein
MAGAGKKTFVQGNVLNASEVNTYLMDQTVMVFADATARDTALPSGTRAEGMVCYLKDVDTFYVYSGTAWVTFGTLGAWTPYTTASLTNMTKGNGTTDFYYLQVGKTVYYRGRLTWGGSTSVAGAISISLPVTAATAAPLTGTLTMRAGGVDYLGYIAGTTTTLAVSAVGSAGTYANRVTSSATVPGTWTSADNITFSITYEAA